MKNERALPLLALGLIAICLTTYWWATRTSTSDSPVELHLDPGFAEKPDQLSIDDERSSALDPFSVPVSPSSDNEFRLDPSLCRTDPLFIRGMLRQYDRVRLSDVKVKAAYLENYRGLSSGDLIGLVDQGDTNALVVLGMMRAYSQMGVPEREIVPLILGELELKTSSVFEWRRRAKANEADFDEARRNLYEAALGGRTDALRIIGILHDFQETGPVQLGWLSKEEFDTLPFSRRMYLSPTMVYRRALQAAFPDVMTSDGATTDELLQDFELTHGEYWQSVVLPIADKFLADVADSGNILPAVMPRATNQQYLEFVADHCD